MLYRRFPKIPDEEISALGFGCMRLPLKGDKAEDIDEAKVDEMLLAAVDAGVNYVDTAWIYHGGRSEPVTGAAIERLGLRERLKLATKCPTWLVKEKGDFDRFLDLQLERLRTDHIDFYLLHALGSERWKAMRELGCLEFLERARRDGRIRHAGFSFHDSLSAFTSIVDGWEGWEFCQVQYNYMDEVYQAGAEGIAYAAGRSIGVIVMEPLRGGGLARVPPAVEEIFATAKVPRRPAEWAFRHVLDRQEVVTVLSGMGSVEQVRENAAVAASARPNSLLAAEKVIIDKARAFFTERQKVPCTACAYCKPCPSGVDIPEVFGMWNAAVMYDDRKGRAGWYAFSLLRDGHGADQCTRCGACLEHCPQHIGIPDRLEEAHAYLTAPQSGAA